MTLPYSTINRLEEMVSTFIQRDGLPLKDSKRIRLHSYNNEAVDDSHSTAICAASFRYEGEAYVLYRPSVDNPGYLLTAEPVRFIGNLQQVARDLDARMWREMKSSIQMRKQAVANDYKDGSYQLRATDHFVAVAHEAVNESVWGLAKMDAVYKKLRKAQEPSWNAPIDPRVTLGLLPPPEL